MKLLPTYFKAIFDDDSQQGRDRVTSGCNKRNNQANLILLFKRT